jgi:hypothetical protein
MQHPTRLASPRLVSSRRVSCNQVTIVPPVLLNYDLIIQDVRPTRRRVVKRTNPVQIEVSNDARAVRGVSGFRCRVGCAC